MTRACLAFLRKHSAQHCSTATGTLPTITSTATLRGCVALTTASLCAHAARISRSRLDRHPTLVAAMWCPSPPLFFPRSAPKPLPASATPCSHRPAPTALQCCIQRVPRYTVTPCRCMGDGHPTNVQITCARWAAERRRPRTPEQVRRSCELRHDDAGKGGDALRGRAMRG